MPLCFACLSADRKLYPLAENKSIFSKIFHNELTIRQSSIPLCWECTAVLRKVKLFKEKVDHAQTVLNYHYLRDKNPKCLSTLTAIKTNPADTIVIQDHSDVCNRDIKQELIECYSETDDSRVSFVPENVFDTSVFCAPTNEETVVINDESYNDQEENHQSAEAGFVERLPDVVEARQLQDVVHESGQMHLVTEDRQDLVIKQELDTSFDEYEHELPDPSSSQDYDVEVKTERMSPELSLAQRNRDVWKRSCLLVYQRLRDHRYVSKFLKKITDDEAPNYSKVIKRPMDLGTIRRNVRNGNIRTTAEFQRDVLLIVTNALMYNSSDHIVYEMALDFFEEAKIQLDLLLEVDGSRVDHSTSKNDTASSAQTAIAEQSTLNFSSPARRTRRCYTINVTNPDHTQSNTVKTTPAPRTRRLNTTVNTNTINTVTPARRSRRLNTTFNATSTPNTPIKTDRTTTKNDKNKSSASTAAKLITRRRTVAGAKITKKRGAVEDVEKFTVKNMNLNESTLSTAAKVITRRSTAVGTKITKKCGAVEDIEKLTVKNKRNKSASSTAAKVITRRRTFVDAKVIKNHETVDVDKKPAKSDKHSSVFTAVKVTTRRRTVVGAKVNKKMVENVEKVTAKKSVERNQKKRNQSASTVAKVVKRRRTVVDAKVTKNNDTVDAVEEVTTKSNESAFTAAKVGTRRKTVVDAKVTKNSDTVDDVQKVTAKNNRNESAFTAAKVGTRRRTVVDAKVTKNNDTVDAVEEVTTKNNESAFTAAKVGTRRKTVVDAKVTKNSDTVDDVQKVTAKNNRNESAFTAAKVGTRRRTVFDAKVTKNNDTVDDVQKKTAKNEKSIESAFTAAKVVTRRSTFVGVKTNKKDDTVDDVDKETHRAGKISKRRTVGSKGGPGPNKTGDDDFEENISYFIVRPKEDNGSQMVEKDVIDKEKHCSTGVAAKVRTSTSMIMATSNAKNVSEIDSWNVNNANTNVANTARKIAKRRYTIAATAEKDDKININHDHDYGMNYSNKTPERQTTVTTKMSTSLPNASADKSVGCDHNYARAPKIIIRHSSLLVPTMDSDGFAIPTPPAPAKVIVLSKKIIARRSTISSLPKNTTFISTKINTSPFRNTLQPKSSAQSLDDVLRNATTSFDNMSSNDGRLQKSDLDFLDLSLAKRRKLTKMNYVQSKPNSTKCTTENAASNITQTTPIIVSNIGGRRKQKFLMRSDDEIILEKQRKLGNDLTDKAVTTSVNTSPTNPAAKLVLEKRKMLHHELPDKAVITTAKTSAEAKLTTENTHKTIRVRDINTLLSRPINDSEGSSIQQNTIVDPSLPNACTNKPDSKKGAINTSPTIHGHLPLIPTLTPKGSIILKARLSQSENVCLATAITTESSRDLTRDEANLIKKSLEDAILKISLDSVSFAPKFRGKPVTADGVVKLWCEDNATLDWLAKTVASIKIPDLVVRKQSELPKKLKCAILLPGNDEFSVILSLLKAQNPWALVDSWVFYSVEQRGENTFLVVGVPSNVIPILMSKEQRLAYSLGSVNINFFKDCDDVFMPPEVW